ncbi:glycosyltransferase, partial [Nocardia sp. No.11]
CARLAARTDAAALVFVDADVRLAPHAIAAAVTELRRRGAGLVSAWPVQESGSATERLVQPLLAWSWASTLPVGPANHSLRPSTAVACGQFLAVDAAAYRAAGGHAAVAASATEDLDLARALRRTGHRTALVAAGPSAGTRMYDGAAELTEGYTRWLWSAYGGRVDAGAAVGALAALAYWIPPLAAL